MDTASSERTKFHIMINVSTENTVDTASSERTKFHIMINVSTENGHCFLRLNSISIQSGKCPIRIESPQTRKGYLKMIRISETSISSCDQCGKPENMEHLLYECGHYYSITLGEN
jgi:hypothetical protein